MSRHAYLVLFISTTSLQVVSAGIHSEDSPTVRGNLFTVAMFDQQGSTYGEARDKVAEVLRMNPFGEALTKMVLEND